jgi:hypothetical protein
MDHNINLRIYERKMLRKIHYLIKSIRTALCSSKLKPRCHYDRTYRYKMRQKVPAAWVGQGSSVTSNVD